MPTPKTKHASDRGRPRLAPPLRSLSPRRHKETLPPSEALKAAQEQLTKERCKIYAVMCRTMAEYLEDDERVKAPWTCGAGFHWDSGWGTDAPCSSWTWTNRCVDGQWVADQWAQSAWGGEWKSDTDGGNSWGSPSTDASGSSGNKGKWHRQQARPANTLRSRMRFVSWLGRYVLSSSDFGMAWKDAK